MTAAGADNELILYSNADTDIAAVNEKLKRFARVKVLPTRLVALASSVFTGWWDSTPPR